jgi:hypothetical protein
MHFVSLNMYDSPHGTTVCMYMPAARILSQAPKIRTAKPNSTRGKESEGVYIQFNCKTCTPYVLRLKDLFFKIERIVCF